MDSYLQEGQAGGSSKLQASQPYLDVWEREREKILLEAIAKHIKEKKIRGGQTAQEGSLWQLCPWSYSKSRHIPEQPALIDPSKPEGLD